MQCVIDTPELALTSLGQTSDGLITSAGRDQSTGNATSTDVHTLHLCMFPPSTQFDLLANTHLNVSTSQKNWGVQSHLGGSKQFVGKSGHENSPVQGDMIDYRMLSGHQSAVHADILLSDGTAPHPPKHSLRSTC